MRSDFMMGTMLLLLLRLLLLTSADDDDDADGDGMLQEEGVCVDEDDEPGEVRTLLRWAPT
jgi:hypothetical protein